MDSMGSMGGHYLRLYSTVRELADEYTRREDSGELRALELLVAAVSVSVDDRTSHLIHGALDTMVQDLKELPD